jgi:hypothetical protein
MLVTCLECGWIEAGNQVMCIHCGNGLSVARRDITSIGGLRISSADGRYAWLLPKATDITLGRYDPHGQFAAGVDLSIADAHVHGVGRMHARLFVKEGRIWLEDLQSSNGSRIGGQVVWPEEPLPLYFGGVFHLGRMSLIFDVA